MAITNYGELKTAVEEWSDRDDLTSLIPDFIEAARARINRLLRSPYSICKAQATTDTEYLELPGDFGGLTDMRLVTNADGEDTIVNLPFVSHVEANDLSAEWDGDTGQPEAYTIVGDRLRLIPAPDQEYTFEMFYYEIIGQMSSSSDTNWVIQYHPDVFVAAAMYEIAEYLRDKDDADRWNQKFLTGVSEIRANNAFKVMGGGRITEMDYF